VAGIFGLPAYRRAEAASIARARRWLDRVGLTDRANDPADTLPYGQQRRLEIIRALCTQPKLLCLDEPAAGLNPRESAELAQLIRAISAEEKLAVLLIEHDMSVVMGISDDIVVLDYGRKIAEGTPAAIRQDKAVIAAYLGEPEVDVAAAVG
jgi:branched-chain amino acid transport system ATP-binding protein